MKFLDNITAGHPGKLLRPVLFTIFSNLVNILPFVLVIYAVKIIFQVFGTSEEPFNEIALWWDCVALTVSMIFIFLC